LVDILGKSGKVLPFAASVPMFRRMHPDVAKLVEVGRIPQAVGERLSQLAPGSFCEHKAWGIGKVTEWDLLGGKVTIDFENQSAQVMGLKFALQKTEPILAGNFRVQKIEQAGDLKDLATADPVELVVRTLESHGGSMRVDALERELATMVPAKEFKKWWDAAKRALRESMRVAVPAKRTDLMVLRDADLSPAAALVNEFEEARDLKAKTKALEAIINEVRHFEGDPDALRRLLTSIDEAARNGLRRNLGGALELLVVRDELVAGVRDLQLDAAAVRVMDVVAMESNRIAKEMTGISAARQRRIFEAFPEAFGEEWVEQVLKVFDEVGARGVTEIAKLLHEREKAEPLQVHVRASLTRRSLGPDALIWLARERHSFASEVFGPEVGASILSLLESDHLDEGPRKTSRLQSLVVTDRELLVDIVRTMDSNEARNFARRLMECQVFGELDRKSLMARVIKARPETGDLVSGENSRKRDEALIVSWESLERKKAELDDVTRNRIPQNTKEIAVARSYGDLRENFEFKAAKQMQAVLMRRKSELEREVDKARGTDFIGADTTTVSIGTIVTLADQAGAESQVTVLGAWDSDPERKIVAYLSELGAALLGAKVGQTVEARDPETELMVRLTVKEIVAYKPA
jgi:transcription elongation GreA/GreB family factor